jgi:putative spermidine/putrescine transport system substrate-binding protein
VVDIRDFSIILKINHKNFSVQKKQGMSTMARKIALLGVAAAALAGSAAAEGTLTFTSYGGAFQEAQRKALLEPISEETGIRFMEDTLTGIAEVRAQVGAGAVTWDIVDLGLSSCSAAQEEGLLELLDYDVIPTAGMNEAAYDTHWVGTIYYSTVLGYSTEVYGDNPPIGWEAFWDVETYPGVRSMRKDPAANLEIALLADGVAPEDLYPIDYDRAFAKLDEIRDHVGVWWTSGAQSAQLIRDGEVDMVTIWNGRLDSAVEDGAQAAYHYDGGIASLDCFAIPRGAPNKDLAMKVIGMMVSPEYAANIPQYINYGPTTELAFETGKIPPEVAARSPSSPENMANQVVLSARWWAENMREAQERWSAWMTQ